MVLMYPTPDKTLQELSYGTFVTSRLQASEYKVVEAKDISWVAAGVPHDIKRRGGPDGELIRCGEELPVDCYFDKRIMFIPKPGQFMEGTRDEEDNDGE